MIEYLYKFEVENVLVFIQNKLSNYEHFLSWISIFVRPSFGFYYFIPLLAIFNTKFHIRVLATGTLANCLTLFFKWIFDAYRPYIWINETNLYTNITRPILKQTPLTCESAPGFPSGHLCFSAATFYVCAVWLIDQLENKLSFPIKFIRYLIWIVYINFLVILTISRIYLGCHFLHQCIIGALIGILCAYFLNSENIFRIFITRSKIEMISYTVIIIIFTFLVGIIQKLSDIDPEGSLKLAIKWCENRMYVTPSSVPYIETGREILTILVFAISSPLNQRFEGQINCKLSSILVISLIFIHKILHINVQELSSDMFYHFINFILDALFSYSCVVLIPKMCKNIKTELQYTKLMT